MTLLKRWTTVFFVLGCWYASPTMAQNHASPSRLFHQLQSDQTTDKARDELLILGKSDRDARQYLVGHLPPLIEFGPRMANCPGYPCRGWTNAVEIAGRLKIGDAAPALARWLTVKAGNPLPGVHPYGNRLTINPTVIALTEIGDPAVPALVQFLSSSDTDEHGLAVHILCTIGTRKAKAVLREHLQHETDPDLRAIIEKTLGEQ